MISGADIDSQFGGSRTYRIFTSFFSKKPWNREKLVRRSGFPRPATGYDFPFVSNCRIDENVTQ